MRPKVTGKHEHPGATRRAFLEHAASQKTAQRAKAISRHLQDAENGEGCAERFRTNEAEGANPRFRPEQRGSCGDRTIAAECEGSLGSTTFRGLPRTRRKKYVARR